jgi:hypothetical protein
MRRRTVLAASMALLGVLSFGAGIGGQDVTTPSYEVTEVKRKLFREQPEPEIQLEVGARPAAGELLRTGSRSSAEIVSPEFAATFLLRSKTRVRLAGDRPGVLLEIERGGLRALFDALSADDPPERLVATPPAAPRSRFSRGSSRSSTSTGPVPQCGWAPVSTAPSAAVNVRPNRCRTR